MESKLKPGFQRIVKTSMKGEKTYNSVTFNPSEANPDERLYVRVPRLDAKLCIVPDTMCLVFNFKNSNTKSWFLNNLSRLLVSQLQVKIGREIVCGNTGECTLALYRYKWLTDDTRKTMFEYGIANENTRKLISGDDSASTSATTEGVTDNSISLSCTNFKLRLGKILNDHGVYSPFNMRLALPSPYRCQFKSWKHRIMKLLVNTH